MVERRGNCSDQVTWLDERNGADLSARSGLHRRPRGHQVTPAEQERAFTFRSIGTGGALSLALACGAPYGNMVVRGSYMALDFSTPGAILLLFLLVGPLNYIA